jgi:hypothetical protein
MFIHTISCKVDCRYAQGFWCDCSCHMDSPIREKRKKIVVGVNTLTAVSQPIYSNHCQFWYQLGKRYPQFDFILNNPRRMSIDNMRNMTAKVALENDVDYILFIDDDVLVPIDTLGQLLSCDADIAAGWTLIRGYPYKNMFFKYMDEARTALTNWQDPVKAEDGFFHVDAVGFSCCLIKMSHVKRVTQPYFITGPYNTEDIYFCIKSLKEHPDTKIVVHPGVLTSHILGLEAIDPLTRDAYKTYFETLYPEAIKSIDKPEENPINRVQVAGDGVNNVSYEDIIESMYGSPVDRG